LLASLFLNGLFISIVCHCQSEPDVKNNEPINGSHVI